MRWMRGIKPNPDNAEIFLSYRIGKTWDIYKGTENIQSHLPNLVIDPQKVGLQSTPTLFYLEAKFPVISAKLFFRSVISPKRFAEDEEMVCVLCMLFISVNCLTWR